MKILLLTTMLWTAFAGGDRERGMQLYKEGKYQEAQAAFTAALKDDPDSAELQWNLALAAWRAGDLATAEVAAEKYAAMSEDVKEELHRGMLGAIRLAESAEWEAKADDALAQMQAAGPAMPHGVSPSTNAPAEPNEKKRDPLRLLKTARRKAATAKRHFVKGVRANPTPELLRNTERTLRKIDELTKRIEELEKQQQQQQNQEGDKNQDEQKPSEDGDQKDENQSDDQKGDEKQSDENKKDEQQPGDQKKPDEKPSEGDQPDQKKPNEQQKEENGEKPDKSEKQEGEGEDQKESSDPSESKSEKPENPEPKPSEQEGKNGESDPTKGEKPENAEPKPEEQVQPGEEQPPTPPEPKPGEQRSDAPGEGAQGLELSPEKAQRLLDRAKKLDEQLKKAKARRTTRRRSVERDW